jgi:hypothetical protein
MAHKKVTDSELFILMDTLGSISNGDFFNDSGLSDERQKATYEYAGVAKGHLEAQGVSTIVDSSTTEVVDGYSAILSELLLDNKKIAKFTPLEDKDPKAIMGATSAQDLTNNEIFVANNGWEKCNTWIKASLMWKNSIIRWDWVEDFSYTFEDYDNIDQETLDTFLSDADVEIVGDLEYENEVDELSNQLSLIYTNVRLRRKKDKSKVVIRNVPPENFRIDRNATSLDDFTYIAIIEEDLTRTELAIRYPEKFKNFDDMDWSGMSDERTVDNQEQQARKHIIGSADGIGYSETVEKLYTLKESWLRVDRDGDGIAELKRIVSSGTLLVEEEDVDEIDLASLSPIEIPHEFNGLSMADVVRSSTMSGTAILRGFIENVYLTNFSPRLADPNMVDFAALQNIKPKQIIATNGNPQTAVAMLSPETISTGTVPLLQHLQINKEQATGLSKAAQGLNDTLYVSGNSEGKMGMAQSAAQKRIQYVARRMVETGFNRLIKGVYRTLKKNAVGHKGYLDRNGVYRQIDSKNLPDHLHIEVNANLGENSNQNMIIKLGKVSEILTQLKDLGREVVIDDVADVRLATRAITALDMNPMDYLVDYEDEEFLKNIEKLKKDSEERVTKLEALEEIKVGYESLAKEANARLVSTQADNAMQDNARQMAVAMDRHHQEWASLAIKADKEGTERPKMPDMDSMISKSFEIIKSSGPGNLAGINMRLAEMQESLNKLKSGNKQEGNPSIG